MNAPPDLCALVGDGLCRPVAKLQDTLQPRKRLFVCGLCLDIGVLDTSVNAAACGFRGRTYLVLDASPTPNPNPNPNTPPLTLTPEP